MIDSLTGNDYTLCLCQHIHALDKIQVLLILPKERIIEIPVNFSVRFIAPSKNQNVRKFKKSIDYIIYILKLIFIIGKSKKQIIHFQFLRTKFDVLFFFILGCFNVKLVYTAHNILPHENKQIDYFLYKIIYQSAKKIIVHSRYIKNKLHNNFNINRSRIDVIPHGDFNIYLPSNKNNNPRKEFGLDNNDNVLLFFGSIRKNKGLDLLLNTFSEISKSQNIKLIIAGFPTSEALRNHYHQKINQIKNNDHIIFHDFYVPFSKVPVYFEAADIVVLPYQDIDHSGVIHLAFSFSKPVITTNVGDFNEFITNGKNGYILDKNDEISLLNSILKAFKDKNKLTEMGKYAYQYNLNHFSWRKSAAMTIETYKGL